MRLSCAVCDRELALAEFCPEHPHRLPAMEWHPHDTEAMRREIRRHLPLDERHALGRYALRRKAEGPWPASDPGWIPGIDLPTTWAEADATRCQLRDADKFEVVDRWELR